MSEPTAASSYRFSWRVLRGDPQAWAIAASAWTAFFVLPLASGAVLRAILDRLSATDTGNIWLLIGALTGFELTRWLLLLPAIWQFFGAYVRWQTVPRANVLASLATDHDPVTGRLPGSPGEAVSRFRDDAQGTADVTDIWLDMTAATVGAVLGLGILAFISGPAAAAICIPVVVILWLGRVLAERLRTWRLQEREATAQVTGFLGDTFGGILAVKGHHAEEAVARRFAAHGEARAEAAQKDQVGTQVAQVLGGITASAGIGLALIAAAPAMRSGQLSAGDVALFTTYATVVSSLPRVAARWSAIQRQGEVSAARLGRLMPGGDADLASAHVATHLRHGPPPFDPIELPHPTVRRGRDRLARLEVRDLHVALDGTEQLAGVDLTIERGQLVVITGPVGAGKSVLVRALLGLVPLTRGDVRWNGERVPNLAEWMVPPRTAYVPQVPRLFSEPLADTILLGLAPDGFDRALRLARLEEDLADMPSGWETTVGPKGVRLSGGQIQRTAAARALIRQPELLVVDDLSSALDVHTEAQLWDGVFDAAGGDLSVLAVSHRPRVLERADVVIHLEAGRAGAPGVTGRS